MVVNGFQHQSTSGLARHPRHPYLLHVCVRIAAHRKNTQVRACQYIELHRILNTHVCVHIPTLRTQLHAASTRQSLPCTTQIVRSGGHRRGYALAHAVAQLLMTYHPSRYISLVQRWPIPRRRRMKAYFRVGGRCFGGSLSALLAASTKFYLPRIRSRRLVLEVAIRIHYY